MPWSSQQVAEFGFWIHLIGIALIGFGILLMLKPDLFKRGIWKTTDIAQRVMTPENYLKYVNKVGIFYIILGIVLIILGPEVIHNLIESLVGG